MFFDLFLNSEVEAVDFMDEGGLFELSSLWFNFAFEFEV